MVVAVDGAEVAVAADTICLHGDTPGAARLAAAVRSRLLAAGVRLLAVGGRRPA
jgi:5-oxoprolinase (ATP-hydrolysing) subunit A